MFILRFLSSNFKLRFYREFQHEEENPFSMQIINEKYINNIKNIFENYEVLKLQKFIKF